jgi:hypothetical protein
MPGVDGLLHVSEIANYRVKDVRDELKEGEQIMVKVINVGPVRQGAAEPQGAARARRGHVTARPAPGARRPAARAPRPWEIEAIAAATVADARRAGIRANPGALPPDPSHTLPTKLVSCWNLVPRGSGRAQTPAPRTSSESLEAF